MTIELAALSAAQPVAAAFAPVGTDIAAQALAQPAVVQEGFGQMVTDGLKGINTDLMASQTDLQQLAVGDVQNLHQLMIRLEENRLSFQVFMQVRNRVLEAYQDVMKMQV